MGTISPLAGKVAANARRQIQVKKKEEKYQKEYRKQYYRAIYNKIQKFSFPPIEQINMEKHFYFPKMRITWKFGPDTILSAFAVYPVICSRADFKEDKWFHLPLESIAALAGISVNTATAGINHLIYRGYALPHKDNKLPKFLLEKSKYNNGKQSYYLYNVNFIREDMIDKYSGTFFIFHTCIIDSGIWAKLKPRAKALYLAMRSTAYFDPQLYREIEDDYVDEYDISKGIEIAQMYKSAAYRNRKWDICKQPLAKLCRMVNIQRTNMGSIFKQLEYYGLVVKLERFFMVFLKPHI